MTRRGIGIIVSVLVAAVLLSLGGLFAVYLLLGREPSVASNAVLRLRVGGDLAEVAPADVFGYLRGVRVPTVQALVDNLRKAKVDRRVNAVLIEPTGFSTPYWGKIQEVRDAILEFSGHCGVPLQKLRPGFAL